MAVGIEKPLKKLIPHLLKAREDNLNEADTRQRVAKVLEDVLSFDALTEISRETQIKDKYVDLAVKLDGSIRFLVETKSAGTILRDRHIDQAQHYAAEGNIPWVVLTNGVVWSLYHLSFDEGIEYTRAFTLDLSTDSLERACELLVLLNRQSIRKGGLEAYWEQHVALSPESIGRALFNADALRLIRREIRRREGILIDEEDLAGAIHNMLSVEARELIGPLKIRRRVKSRRSNARADASGDSRSDIQSSATHGNESSTPRKNSTDHTPRV